MLSIIYFFLGASLGSFTGLICDRFPEKSIIFPRSHCSHCKHQLRFFEIIPILSQLFLKSRCRSCQTPIPFRYLFIELFCGVICLLYFYDFLSLEVTYFLYFSLCLSIFDLKHKSYPLLIWIVGTVPLLFMGNYYITFALGTNPRYYFLYETSKYWGRRFSLFSKCLPYFPIFKNTTYYRNCLPIRTSLLPSTKKS